MYLNETHCCGVGDFSGLNDIEFSVEQALRTMHEEGAGNYGQIFMCAAWSGRKRPRATFEGRFNAFATYVVNNKLGDFYDVNVFTNPTHQNKTTLRTGMFEPNWDAIEEWYDEKGYEDEGMRGYRDPLVGFLL